MHWELIFCVFCTCDIHILFYSIVLYCTYCISLWCIVLIVFHCTVLCNIVLHCAVLYCTVLYYIVLYCIHIVLYCTSLYCIIFHLLYFIILYCTVFIIGVSFIQSQETNQAPTWMDDLRARLNEDGILEDTEVGEWPSLLLLDWWIDNLLLWCMIG